MRLGRASKFMVYGCCCKSAGRSRFIVYGCCCSPKVICEPAGRSSLGVPDLTAPKDRFKLFRTLIFPRQIIVVYRLRNPFD